MSRSFQIRKPTTRNQRALQARQQTTEEKSQQRSAAMFAVYLLYVLRQLSFPLEPDVGCANAWMSGCACESPLCVSRLVYKCSAAAMWMAKHKQVFHHWKSNDEQFTETSDCGLPARY